MRLVHTQASPDGRTIAKVRYSSALQEYTVRLFIDGEPLCAGDYFTDDKQDAIATSVAMVERWNHV